MCYVLRQSRLYSFFERPSLALLPTALPQRQHHPELPSKKLLISQGHSLNRRPGSLCGALLAFVTLVVCTDIRAVLGAVITRLQRRKLVAFRTHGHRRSAERDGPRADPHL